MRLGPTAIRGWKEKFQFRVFIYLVNSITYRLAGWVLDLGSRTYSSFWIVQDTEHDCFTGITVEMNLSLPWSQLDMTRQRISCGRS